MQVGCNCGLKNSTQRKTRHNLRQDREQVDEATNKFKNKNKSAESCCSLYVL